MVFADTAGKSGQRGFSLVELSIVLVILGLLVGGILGGQSLIRAAELRAVVTEYQQWQMAVNSFRQKYQALPGDMPNATRFWGLARTGETGCYTWVPGTEPVDVNGGMATCNGDGNGSLLRTSTVIAEGDSFYEANLFWGHLRNAGLVNALNTIYPRTDVLDVASRLGNAFWGAQRSYSDIRHTEVWLVGAGLNNSVAASIAAISPEEAWGIDVKMDDGMPFTGGVKTLPGNGAAIGTAYRTPDCTRSAAGGVTTLSTSGAPMMLDYEDEADAVYHLGHNGVACMLKMRL